MGANPCFFHFEAVFECFDHFGFIQDFHGFSSCDTDLMYGRPQKRYLFDDFHPMKQLFCRISTDLPAFC